KVYEHRARKRLLQINVDGVRAMVRGSQKTFPTIPAVLIENAIKYARPRTGIRVEISALGRDAILDVENETDYDLDPITCFDRGVRFATEAAEGAGFGLYLAREVVHAHKGRIACHKSPGNVCF